MAAVKPKIIPLGQGCKERWPMGRRKLQKLAEDAGAIIRIGKLVYINVTIMDRYFDEISDVE